MSQSINQTFGVKGNMSFQISWFSRLPMDTQYRSGRDSFDDRICDDLSQEVLKYLSFEDKIRLQCVSKRFARTIFLRQKRLVVRSNHEHSLVHLSFNEVELDQDINQLMYSHYNHQERYGMMGMDYDCLDQIMTKTKTCTGAIHTEFNSKALESVLRKCANISSIGIQNYRIGYNENNTMINLIINLCNNLREIDLVFNLVTKDDYDKFVANFRHNLRKCDFYSGYYLEYRYLRDLLTKCPKLEHLNLLGNYRNHSIRSNFTHKFENLKSLSFWLCGHEDKVIVEKLMTDCKNTLERIDIWVYTTSQQYFDSIFSRIYNLPNLKSLKFDFNSQSESNYWWEELEFSMPILFPTQFAIISMVCLNVRNIEIKTHSLLSICSQVYETMKTFGQLQRLVLYFRYTESDIEYNYSSETLKDCKRLTHLSLNIPLISRDFFDKVDKHLPFIRYIRLEKVPESFPVHHLCNLTKLKTITLI